MKSYIKTKSIRTFAIAIIFFSVSCSHKESIKTTEPTDNNSMLSIIERYYKMENTPTEGSFMFESNVTNNDPKITKSVISGGFFTDNKGQYETDGGNVSIGGRLLTNKNGWYGFDKVDQQAGMYGTNVTFSLNPPISQNGRAVLGQGGSTALTATVYSPLAINITNVAPRATIKLVPNTNTAITWNADPKDSNGVVIIASYVPTRIFNYYANKAGYTHALNSSELVADNGSTSVPWSFFSQFPVGSHISFWVARGNYTILSNGDYSYKVGGYTAAAVWDVVIPTPPISITASNATGLSGFTAKYTNTATSAVTSFGIPANGGSLGTLPPGTYNLVISKTSNTTSYYFSTCDLANVHATSATFNNVNISNADCNTISIQTKNIAN